jgi:hypothetical protein
MFQNLNLIEINKLLENRIENYEIISDINLTKEEYRELLIKVIDVLEYTDKGANLEIVVNNSPLVFATLLVYIAIYEYEGNFWDKVKEVLQLSELSQQSRAILAENIPKVINKYNLKKFDDGGYKYITPIMCHSGIPNKSLPGVFDIILNNYDDTTLTAEALIDNIKYFIRHKVDKTVYRFITFNEDRAVTFLHDLKDLVTVVEDNRLDLSEAIVKYSYLNEKNIDKEKKKSRNRILSPKIKFDGVSLGIYLYLPVQHIDKQYNHYIEWDIEYDNGENETISAELYYKNRECISEEQNIALKPSNIYKISLSYDSEILGEWIYDGINGERPYIIFDEDDNIVKGNKISTKNVTCILEEEYKIANDGLEVTYCNLPNKYWCDFKCVSIMLLGECNTIKFSSSREQMRKNPPHFLLTNYAMLEYLLLRPQDNDFFDGEHSNEWKFIVLDEAHSYKGANGAEVSLLLKRLKERVNGGEQGKIQCIATSATLGGGKEDYPKVAQFASDLFSEKFNPEYIVKSSRVNIASRVNECIYRSYDFYNDLKDDYYLFIEGKKTLDELKNEYKIIYDTDDIDRVLYEILKEDENLLALQKELGEETKSIDKVVDLVLKKDVVEYKRKEEALISLIDISSKAKVDKESKALLPARYHLFVRALEGMYASFYPHKEVYLERREKIRVANNSEVTVFELANCQKCGQEYIVGSINKLGYLTQYTNDFEDSSKTMVYFMIDNSEDSIDSIDEDEGIIYKADNSKAEDWILCCVCEKVEKAGKVSGFSCCNVNDNRKYIKVKKIVKKTHSLNACMACGGVSPNIVKRFLTSYDPATNILATSLYEMIPSSTIESKIDFSGDNNKNTEDDWFIDGDVFGEVSSTLANNVCKEEKNY